MMLEEANRKLLRNQGTYQVIHKKHPSTNTKYLKGKNYLKKKLELHKSMNKSPQAEQLLVQSQR